MQTDLPELDLRSTPEYRMGGQVFKKIRSRRGWDVLKLLAREPGQPMSRTSLASELWPEDPTRAAQNLRQTLCYLKRALPGSDIWLQVGRVDVMLDPSRIHISGEGRLGRNEEGGRTQWEWLSSSAMDPYPLQQALIGLSPTLIAAGRLRMPLERSRDVISRPELLTPEFRLTLAELYAAAGSFPMAEVHLREVAKADAALPKIRAHRLLLRSLIDARLFAYSSAEPNAQTALKLAGQVKDHEIAIRALTVLAYCAYALDRPEDVPQIAKKGLSLCRAQGRTLREAHLQHALMCAYQRLGNENAACEVIETGLKTIRKTPAPIHGIIVARFGRGLEGYGRSQRAANLFNEALTLLEGSDYMREIAETRTYLGDWHYDRGSYADSFDHHIRAVGIRRAMPEPHGLATSLRGAGAAALGMRDLDVAEKHLKESMKLAGLGNSPSGVGSAGVLLSRTVALKGDKRKAAKLLGTAIGLLSSLEANEYSLRLPSNFPTLSELEKELLQLRSSR